MMDVEVGQWDTGKGGDMCYIMDVAVGQWDSGTQDKVVLCVFYDGYSSGSVGHRTR
jgi:hypothetical protein